MKIKVHLLKSALVIIALFAIFISIIFSIQFFSGGEEPIFVNCLFISFILSVILGFRVLFLLNRILNYIKASEAFSAKTLKVVSKIKKTILLISVVFLGMLPFFYTVADRQDAPGFLIIGLAVVSLPFAAFIFSLIVEELFICATNLKTDSELTI